MQRREKGTPRDGKEISQRQLKMGELIRHTLSEACLREGLIDQEGQPISVTFTEVRCAPDLRMAKAYFTPLGPVPLANCEFALQAALPQLQAAVAKKSTAKFTPKLSFRYDDSFDQADHMRSLLDGLST